MENELHTRLDKVKTFSENMELKAAGKLVSIQICQFQEYIQGNRKKFVWTNMLLPPELVYAKGLIPIQTELIAGWLSSLSLSGKYISSAHSSGFHNSLCSYHKVVIGAMQKGIIPPPEVGIFSSHLCDGGGLLARYLSQKYNTKVIILEVPHAKGTDSRKLVAGEVARVLSFLEECGGKDNNNKRLKNTLFLSNAAREYLVKANKLREKEYLFEGYLSLRNMYGAAFVLGSEAGVEVARTYYEELRERSPVSEGAPRILWIHFAPLYDGSIMKYFENNLNLKISFDITGHIYWNNLIIENPLNALAEKLLSHFYLGDTKTRLAFYEKIIKDYRIDGVVFFMHQNCRAIACSAWELKVLSQQMRIPLLEISGDCIDPAGSSTAQMKLRMEAFSERLFWHK